ncbi:putative transmembrane alpha-helix domain-protein [Podospora conica]|nr:putative transmembrane alpha-helix domain-protein [Schizothecium conicum]
MADRTVIQASAVFPFNPLTTTFTAPGTRCSGINFPTTLNNIAMFHDEPSCLPQGFSTAQSAFFSPGVVCPSGYYSACHDTAGIATVTTVTCCPALADRGITFTCVDPKTLAGVFTSKFCSWQAPASPGLPVAVTRSDTSRRTSTVVETMISPGGINAFGIRMVHQATDLPDVSTTTSSGASSSGSSPTSAGVTGPGQSGLPAGQTDRESSSGLSQGAMIGIGVAVAVLVLAALAGLFLWWRRKRRAAASAPLPASPQAEALMPENKYYYSGHAQHPPVHQAKDGWGPAPMSELSSTGVAEMPAQTYIVELPERQQR